jgi:hypothetical protein
LHLCTYIFAGEDMNREDIIRMAIEAGLNLYVNDLTEKQYLGVIERFAALVASAEREACANIAHQWSKREDDVGGYIEAAIRARGQA